MPFQSTVLFLWARVLRTDRQVGDASASGCRPGSRPRLAICLFVGDHACTQLVAHPRVLGIAVQRLVTRRTVSLTAVVASTGAARGYALGGILKRLLAALQHRTTTPPCRRFARSVVTSAMAGRFPLPLSTYSPPEGLRQDPGGGAESSTDATTCGNGGHEVRVLSTYEGNAAGAARCDTTASEVSR